MNKIKPLITVHSGGLAAPANSLLYLERACSLAPDIIEVDVRVSADQIPVLSHEACLPDSPVPIRSRYYKELKAGNADLLTLEEAIVFCATYKISLNLDIKELEAIQSTAGLVRQKEYHQACIFSGCGEAEVRALFSEYAEARVLLNAEHWDVQKFPDYSTYAQFLCHQAETLGCFGINICHYDLRPELMGYSRLFDIPVLVWTVDDKETMKNLIMLGVYSITTNEVELLQQVLSEVSNGNVRRLYDTRWVNRS